jgi:hypothetical protein
MKITLATILISLTFASEISAGLISSRPNGHAMLARRMNRQKRCIQRHGATLSSTAGTPTSSSAAAPAPSSEAPAPAPSDNGNNDNNNNNNNNNNSGGGGSQPGTIQADGSPCGGPNASTSPTKTGGPNGSEEWLTCNIRSSGWAPPPIFRSNIKYVDLGSVINDPHSLFYACRDYLGDFNYHAGQTGLPAILLASIALQESSCNRYARGPNGEYGLMQLTGEKCPSNGDCLDPGTNIGIGARYLASTADSVGGNLAQAMGMYNGWFPGMTEGDANGRPTCGQRSNLDYLQTVFNGYLQGVDPSSLDMGMFFNTRC